VNYQRRVLDPSGSVTKRLNFVPLIHKMLTTLRISAGWKNRPNENEQTKQLKIMLPLHLVKWSQIFQAFWYNVGFTFVKYTCE